MRAMSLCNEQLAGEDLRRKKCICLVVPPLPPTRWRFGGQRCSRRTRLAQFRKLNGLFSSANNWHACLKSLSLTTKLPAQADFTKVLLERYQEAIARSRKIGHRVSFRVEVDPTAAAPTITPVEEQPLASDDGFPVEDTATPDAELEAALAGARERGRRRVAEIVAGDDMLSAEGFAKLLGTSRVTVNARRQSGQVLGIDGASGRARGGPSSGLLWHERSYA